MKKVVLVLGLITMGLSSCNNSEIIKIENQIKVIDGELAVSQKVEDSLYEVYLDESTTSYQMDKVNFEIEIEGYNSDLLYLKKNKLVKELEELK